MCNPGMGACAQHPRDGNQYQHTDAITTITPTASAHAISKQPTATSMPTDAGRHSAASHTHAWHRRPGKACQLSRRSQHEWWKCTGPGWQPGVIRRIFPKLAIARISPPISWLHLTIQNYYRLGTQYASLQPTIDHFAGSWSRQSLAVKGGVNVAAALNPIWADPKQCKAGETPIACEIRVYNPSIVTVSMEESWSGDIVKYNMYLRQIVEYILSQNVVPILATRAELPGSSKSINETVARIAYDYQVPLWNFWAATNTCLRMV